MLRKAQEAFFQLDQLLMEIERVDVFYRECLKRIAASFNAGRVSLMLVDETRKELLIQQSQGLAPGLKDRTRVKLGQGIAGWVAEKGESLLVRDIDQEQLFRKEKKKKGFKSGSFVVIPVKRRGKVYGVLNVAEKKDGTPFTEDDLRALELFGIQLAILIENERLRQQAGQLKGKPAGELAKASHDILIPLSCIKEAVELLSEELVGPLNEKQKEFLCIAEQNVRRMSRICERLTEGAGEETSGKDAFHPTDLSELLRELCKAFQGKAKRKKIEICFSAEKGDPVARTDGGKLYEVFLNLIDNAVKFTRRGGRIRVTVRPAASWVRTEIADEGPGIDPEEGRILFNKEERLKRARGRGQKRPGHGLGLAISRDIIQGLGGLMGYRSQKGQGALFYVEIPRS